MPLFKDLNLDDDLRLILWKIEESPSFFEDRLSVKQLPSELSNIRSPKRKLELLVAKYLWFKVLGFNEHYSKTAIGKPVHHFASLSISHSDDILAFLIGDNPNTLIGADVQVFGNKLEGIISKFCSEKEVLLFGDDNLALTKIWTAKEAAYKMFGLKGVIWKTNMQLIEVSESGVKMHFKVPGFSATVDIHWIKFERFLVAYCKNT
jgi:phosphopantetheinyl transferase